MTYISIQRNINVFISENSRRDETFISVSERLALNPNQKDNNASGVYSTSQTTHVLPDLSWYFDGGKDVHTAAK